MEPGKYKYDDVIEYCEGKEIFIQDLFGGADPSHRLSTRIYTEYAWHSLFIQNLLIEVEDIEKKDFIAFIQSIQVEDSVKQELLNLTPENYLGFAAVLAKKI